MPTARLALVRAFPILGGSTAARSAYGYQNRSGNSGTGRRSRAVLASASTGRSTRQGDIADIDAKRAMGGGIKYEKSFTVQYSDHDEASLVHMRDLDLGGERRATGRATSESSL